MYTRQNPSPRYRELVQQYQLMHTHGEQRLGIPAEETFPGHSIRDHLGSIKSLVQKHSARTILDYGSGKGVQYTSLRVNGASLLDYWGVSSVRCYDPGYAPYNELPAEQFDGVVCTDVLEHCPEDDLDWIVDELFGFARKFLFATIASFPAQKHLPNGENAHCTVYAQQWWMDRLMPTIRRHPHVTPRIIIEHTHQKVA